MPEVAMMHRNLTCAGASARHRPERRHVLPPAKAYDGYRSYSYLEEGKDYPAFELVPGTRQIRLWV